MPGDERAREGAAVERLEHRSLDLEVAALVEPPAQGRDQARAAAEDLAHLEVHEQIGVALAEAGLGIAQAVPLLGQRPQRLGEHREALDPHRDLAGPGAEHRALDADPIADVEQLVALERPLEPVGAKVELELPGRVEQVGETRLAVAAQAHEASRDAHARAVLLGHAVAERQDLGGVMGDVVAVGVGLDPQRAPLLELLAALADQLFERHGASLEEGRDRTEPGARRGDGR